MSADDIEVLRRMQAERDAWKALATEMLDATSDALSRYHIDGIQHHTVKSWRDRADRINRTGKGRR